MKLLHKIIIGSRIYEVTVDAKKSGEHTLIVSDSLVKSQQELALTLLSKTPEFDLDLFNFALDVSGQKASSIADQMEVTRSLISQIRRGKTEPSKMLWKFFRVVLSNRLGNQQGTIETGRRHVDQILAS